MLKFLCPGLGLALLASLPCAATATVAMHYPLDAESLVPIDESGVWRSPCNPVGDVSAEQALKAIKHSMLRQSRPSFDDERVRVVIYSKSQGTLFLDADYSVKLIGHRTVDYFKVPEKSATRGLVKSIFGTCTILGDDPKEDRPGALDPKAVEDVGQVSVNRP